MGNAPGQPAEAASVAEGRQAAANDPRAFKGRQNLEAIREKLRKSQGAQQHPTDLGYITRRFEAYVAQTARRTESPVADAEILDDGDQGAVESLKTERRAGRAGEKAVVAQSQITAFAAKAWKGLKDRAAAASPVPSSFLAVSEPAQNGESSRSQRSSERRGDVQRLLAAMQKASTPADRYRPLEDLLVLLRSNESARAEAASQRPVLAFLVSAATTKNADRDARDLALQCLAALLSQADTAKPADAVRSIWGVKAMFDLMERLRDNVTAHQAAYVCLAGACRSTDGCKAIVKAGLHENILNDLTDPFMSNEYRVPPSLALVRLCSVAELHAALLAIDGNREESEVDMTDDGSTPMVVQVLRAMANYPIDEVRLNGATAIRLLATDGRVRTKMCARRVPEVLCARLTSETEPGALGGRASVGRHHAEAHAAIVGAICSLSADERAQDVIVARNALPRLMDAVRMGPAGRAFREAIVAVAAVCRNPAHREHEEVQASLAILYPYSLPNATDDPVVAEAVSAAVWPDDHKRRQQRILDALRATAIADRRLVEESASLQAGGKAGPRERWRRAFKLLRTQWAAEKLNRTVGSGQVAHTAASHVRSFAGRKLSSSTASSSDKPERPRAQSQAQAQASPPRGARMAEVMARMRRSPSAGGAAGPGAGFRAVALAAAAVSSLVPPSPSSSSADEGGTSGSLKAPSRLGRRSNSQFRSDPVSRTPQARVPSVSIPGGRGPDGFDPPPSRGGFDAPPSRAGSLPRLSAPPQLPSTASAPAGPLLARPSPPTSLTSVYSAPTPGSDWTPPQPTITPEEGGSPLQGFSLGPAAAPHAVPPGAFAAALPDALHVLRRAAARSVSPVSHLAPLSRPPPAGFMSFGPPLPPPLGPVVPPAGLLHASSVPLAPAPGLLHAHSGPLVMPPPPGPLPFLVPPAEALRRSRSHEALGPTATGWPSLSPYALPPARVSYHG